MIDYFELLQEQRRPHLEVAALKQHFLQLSSAEHPDRFHTAPEEERQRANQRYAALNTAYICLREPKERLRHLLELESPARLKDIQRIPPGTMDLFVEVGQLCRDVDAFLAERNQVTSPILKVQWFQKGLEWTDKLNTVQQRVNAKRNELTAELEQMNTAWEQAPPPGAPDRPAALPLERLEQIYRTFSYTSRWTEQIQEHLVQLSC